MGAFCQKQKQKTTSEISGAPWISSSTFINLDRPLNAILLLSTALRCEQRQTEYINTIRPQVLDFYNRLSRALGDTLANADDMKAGGIQLQKVPISSPLSSSFLSSSSIITENLQKNKLTFFFKVASFYKII